MVTKFLYIDDDLNAHGIVKNIENKNLTFETIIPCCWNNQVADLIDSKKIDTYDGLLLDLKLEFTPEESQNDNGDALLEPVKFTGADLATRIRTSVKSGLIKDLPIFLCSTDANFMSFFDKTSNDLFDKKLNKNNDFKEFNQTASTFVSYSNAYKKLNQIDSLERLLDKRTSENEDLQILLLEFERCTTPHEKMYLLDRFFIDATGPLIDENLLAIRLGIDIENSPNWSKFLEEILTTFQFKGILSDIKKRWWNLDVINYFLDEFEINLRALDAEEKVKLIMEKTNFSQLTAIKKLQNQEFTTFWYRCKLSNLPLDILDGLRTIEVPRYPWIDQNYLCNQYLLSEERDKKAINSSLGPYEKQSFEEMMR